MLKNYDLIYNEKLTYLLTLRNKNILQKIFMTNKSCWNVIKLLKFVRDMSL